MKQDTYHFTNMEQDTSSFHKYQTTISREVLSTIKHITGISLKALNQDKEYVILWGWTNSMLIN